MESTNITQIEENEPLIDKEPVLVKLVPLEEWNDVCCDKELHNLLHILKDSNKTLDVITEEYSKRFEEKSKTTIHRYLKTYIKRGYIIESGRIIRGKQHTAEKMYTNSAKIFFIDNQYVDAWRQGERSDTLALKIGVLALSKFNNRGFDKSDLHDIFLNFEEKILSTSVKVLEEIQSVQPEIASEILDLDNDERLVFFAVLKSAFFYLTRNILKNFKSGLEEIFTKEPLNIRELLNQTNMKKDKFADLIIKKPTGYQTNYTTRKTILFTDFEKYTKYVLDLNYTSLFIIFGVNDFPLSVKTITELFPKAYELAFESFSCKLKSSEAKKLEKDVDKNKNLSENRIYRLIQDLKNEGLVIEAGRQISKDSSKTSILYTTTAKKTIYLENRDEFWKQEQRWKNLVLLIAKILKFHYQKENLDEEKFYELFTKIEKLKFDSYKQMLDEVPSEEIANFYHHSLNVIELNSSISALGAINVFFQDEDIFALTKELCESFS